MKTQRHGRWKPSKHFLGVEGVPAFDGAGTAKNFNARRPSTACAT